MIRLVTGNVVKQELEDDHYIKVTTMIGDADYYTTEYVRASCYDDLDGFATTARILAELESNSRRYPGQVEHLTHTKKELELVQDYIGCDAHSGDLGEVDKVELIQIKEGIPYTFTIEKD